jgi:nucleoid-associated protein YgaU
MTIFTIDETDNITAFANAAQAAAATVTPFDLFTDQKELAELLVTWPAERLVATYNSLPGVKPVKTLKNPQTAASKIWERVAQLGQMVAPEPVPAKPETAKAKAAPPAKAGVQSAQGAPTKAKAGKKATPAKAATKAKKGAPAAKADGPRAGSKMAQVIAMMQRKNGVSIEEIMQAMSWQRHTVRGFVAGAMKKAGYSVESFRPEGGARSYRLPK